MRFLSPLALVGLALIALPVAIHLLVRQRATRMDYPSLKFLRETPSFRFRPRHIQQPLLLALRIAAIALLVLGLSRPLITFGTRTQRTCIILLDGSLSMQARGRTEATRELVRRLINDLAPGERAAIVVFSSDSLLLSPMTSDKRELNEALNRYQPTSGAANYSESFKAADALLQSEPPGDVMIDLISDFQASGLPHERLVQLDSGPIARAKIITYPVGAELERNSYLIDEEVIADESRIEVTGSELISTVDERSGVRKSWTMDSRDGEVAGLVWHTEQNGQVTARITTFAPDEFDADDERFLAFTPPRKGRALVIERDGDDAAPYLRAALEATATDLGEKRFIVDAEAALPGSSSELAPYSLVTLTLHGAPRLDELHTLVDYARAGGTVWLCVGNDLDTNQWNQFAKSENGRAFPFLEVERKSDANQASVFGSVDSDSPVLRFMNEQVITTLRTVRMHGGFVVSPRVGSAILMRWNDATPAFVGSQVGSGRVLLLATSPARAAGDLGVTAAFPALASSIARFGIAPSEPLAREIGQPVNLGLAAKVSVKITDAKGKSVTTEASDLITHPANYFPSPGIYYVESEKVVTYLAFNSPNTESEIPLAPAADVEKLFKVNTPATVPSTSAWHDATERLGNAWRYFLFVAFGLLIAELFITMKQGGGEQG